MRKWWLILISCLQISVTYGQTAEMALVKGGDYLPLYGIDKEEKVSVNSFYMDTKPVTHADFLAFVKKFDQWQKSRVRKLFADERYLSSWEGDLQVPEELMDKPVNNVSWFAAKAYCECQGKRLPNVDEWEYAAMADAEKPDARRDSLFNTAVLRTYEKPKTYLIPVGAGEKNYWGIHDLHGMVWEWTLDFNSVIITGESRNNGNTDKGLFCVGGAMGATDLMNYAAFIRYAMRTSLKANYTLNTLGFRCAKDVQTAFKQ